MNHVVKLNAAYDEAVSGFTFGSELDEELAHLGSTSVKRLAKGEVLYRRDEPAHEVYVVRQGWLKRRVETEHGKGSIICLEPAGTFLGDDTLSPPFRRWDTVLAVDDVEVRVILRHVFLDVVSSGPWLGRWVGHAVHRLRQREQMLSHFITLTSEQRLVMRLLELAEPAERDGAARVDVRLTHCELAELVGTTRSRVGLFLKQLEDAGACLRTRTGWIVHSDRALGWVYR